MVGTINRSTNRPSDAGVVMCAAPKGLGAHGDCNARYVEMDPEIGTAIAVAEAARNISCSGGVPSAITNCRNFGNLHNPEVYWQFVKAIEGMGRSCRHFNTPVTGGNELLQPIGSARRFSRGRFPDPNHRHGGVIEDRANHMSLNFKEKGEPSSCSAKSPIASMLPNTSPASQSGPVSGPHFNLEAEGKVQGCVRKAIERAYSRRARCGRRRLVVSRGDGDAERTRVRCGHRR